MGQPLCWDCYDYRGHVLWHAVVPELWRRTTIYARRELARLTGLSVRAVSRAYRISYVKVAEWQRRGAIHLHVIARLDGVDQDDPERVVPPPDGATATLLEEALRAGAARAVVRLPEIGSRVREAVWGPQLDVRPVTDPLRAAAYLAKYSVKTAADTFAGLPVRRFTLSDVAWLRRRGVSPHVLLLVLACFRLSQTPGGEGLGLAEHVHTLGFAGHFSTRSRRYSVTLGALRAARRAWRTEHPDTDTGGDTYGGGDGGRDGDPWAAARTGDGVAVVGSWRYVGSGFARLGDVTLAATIARNQEITRLVEKEAAYEASLIEAMW